MSGKVVQLPLFPESEKQMTKYDVERYFNSLFAQNSKLREVVDELGETVFNMKKRLDNISKNYLEKLPPEHSGRSEDMTHKAISS